MMGEAVRPDWEEVRRIVRDWLNFNKLSQNKLAAEAGLNRSIVSRFFKGQKLDADSAIKLFNVMKSDMDPIDRRDFLKAIGLLPLVLALGHDTPNLVDFEPEVSPRSSYEVGTRLLLTGLDRVKRSWEEAIPIFLRAEQAFGPASSQAARAACLAIQILINLGDYDKAECEVIRVQNTYEMVMDPETKADLYRIRGWLDYYQGNFLRAKESLENCISIAQQYGDENIAESAQHFLGRVYCDWGQTLHRKQETDLWYFKAEMQFDKVYQIHLKTGNEGQQAFDLLRKAQLLQVQNREQEAQQLRDRARQMFGRDIAVLHIELEEARQGLIYGEIKAPRRKAEEAVRGWAQIKYAKGMADALKILGDLEYYRAELEEALKLYAAALCIYPFDNHLANRHLWEEVKYINTALAQEDKKNHYNLLQDILESAYERKYPFSYLNHLHVDRSQDISKVLSKLSSGKLK